ncbi:MAG TPA: type II toxin-antitoxin system RelE/ParE family toxin [Polyangiales bacterium]
MTLPVELDPRAEQEARATFQWYLERSPRTAVMFEQELDRAIACIGEAPTVYPIIDGELRRYLFDHFPYALIYAITPNCVRVIAIAHQHRRPGYRDRR